MIQGQKQNKTRNKLKKVLQKLVIKEHATTV